MVLKLKSLLTEVKTKVYKLSVKGELPHEFTDEVRDVIATFTGQNLRQYQDPDLMKDGYEIETKYSSYYMQDPNYKSYLTLTFNMNKFTPKDTTKIWSHIKGML